jgi:hypothetical protein
MAKEVLGQLVDLTKKMVDREESYKKREDDLKRKELGKLQSTFSRFFLMKHGYPLSLHRLVIILNCLVQFIYITKIHRKLMSRELTIECSSNQFTEMCFGKKQRFEMYADEPAQSQTINEFDKQKRTVKETTAWLTCKATDYELNGYYVLTTVAHAN